MRCLAHHTLISKQIINPMLTPSMSSSGLKKTLRLLVKNGVIDRRLAHGKAFFEIAQDLPGRTKAADLIGCASDDLFRPKIRTGELLHHELCEYWIWTIRRLFPLATIIRADEIDGSELAQEILLADKGECEVFPDFLLHFPTSEHNRWTTVAFEIERTRKSNQRIIRKIKKYTCEARLDGVVYICDSARLSETIRLLYLKANQKRSQRIGHYSDFFFMLSNAIEPNMNPLDCMFNACGQPVYLDRWIMQLLTTKLAFRRPHEFADVLRGDQLNPDSAAL
ncbi:MAG: hypothetical protein EOP05_02665 [Proteobacteria bacterium]|nr:MAG: hypothetical protein EOP05_02665 [Pseudomonadota bacterium]